MKKRGFIVVSALVLLSFSLVFAESEKGMEVESYRIGGVFSITGPASFLGEPLSAVFNRGSLGSF